MDEGYEALTLMQTGKSQLMPLVLIDRPGGTYWKTWDKHVREHLLRDQLICQDDLNLYQITDDTDQAGKSSHFLSLSFQSLRPGPVCYPTPNTRRRIRLLRLNEDFADIIIGPELNASIRRRKSWPTTIMWICRGSRLGLIGGIMGDCGSWLMC